MAAVQIPTSPLHTPDNTDDLEEGAWKLVTNAKTALARNGGIYHWKISLRRQLHILKDRESIQQESDGDPHEILVDGWVNETLRWLAIKTLSGDTTKPFQLAPGDPIELAWKALMIMPSHYANVCYSMGNDFVIDHDPFDTIEQDEEEKKHIMKRYNCSLRLYVQYFNGQPPLLYWKEPKVQKTTISEYIGKIFCS